MKELQCTYKNELYSVRDDGSVLRHTPIEKKTRPTDNKWTFGKWNEKIGYMEIASVRVHRIVATAFHGPEPTKEHVVDHIDTNKKNNRPENLRWVTRLENILLNPITARRIELVCGSVEAFLANPPAFRDKFPEPNLSWMCTVSAEEGQASYKRLLAWAQSDKAHSGGSLGPWLFERMGFHVEQPDTIPSLTSHAVQRNWNIPSEFPCCPQEFSDRPLETYLEKMQLDSVFCLNNLYCSLVDKAALSPNQESLFVVTRNKDEEGIKPYALAEIAFENNLFVHTSIRSFFTYEGAEKEFCLAQGLEWLGGDSVDDYC